MRTLKCLSAIVVVAMIFAAVPSMAEVFTIHMKNGNSFETRYQPRLAAWDESKVVFLTDLGNRITLYKEDIAEISAETEIKGYGTMIDTTTIVLGWAPNDAPLPGEQTVDPAQEWMNFLEQQTQQRDFSVDQFVEPSEAGQGGLPSWEFGSGAYGGGGAQVVPLPGFGGGTPPAPQPVPLPAGPPPSSDDGGS